MENREFKAACAFSRASLYAGAILAIAPCHNVCLSVCGMGEFCQDGEHLELVLA